jgi:tripeptidyl-peptidase-1
MSKFIFILFELFRTEITGEFRRFTGNFFFAHKKTIRTRLAHFQSNSFFSEKYAPVERRGFRSFVKSDKKKIMAKSDPFYLTILCLFYLIMVSVDGKHAFMERSKLHVRHDVRVVRDASANVKHKLIFGIKQNNLDRLTDILHEVSDPLSPEYGQHWSKEDVAKLTANPEGRYAVMSYLEANNIVIVDQTLNGEYITAEATVRQWEGMLNCKFRVYQLLSADDKETESSYGDLTNHIIRTDSYSVPEELSNHLFAVFNTVQFPHRIPKSKQQKPISELKIKDDQGISRSFRVTKQQQPQEYTDKMIDWKEDGLQEGFVTPAFLAIYYDVPFTQVDSTVTQAVLESLDDALNPNDLTAFQKEFNLDVQPIAPDAGGQYRGHVSKDACNPKKFASCGESNLDVQYMMGMAQGSPTSYIYVDEGSGQLDWLDFVKSAANSAHPAHVYSISYGTYELGLSESTTQAFETEVIKLGVMGTTVVASSGDDGVVGFYARRNASFCGYYAQYPASCPYVLAVGGTNGPQENKPEIACMSSPSGGGASITTGGGFSNHYPVPSYQRNFTEQYFKRVNGTAFEPFHNYDKSTFLGIPVQPSFFNHTGRGYPDVSLVAHNYLVFVDGQQVGVDGTSASAPVMGALITLTNYHRKLQGNSTMGWINPFIYHYSSRFIRDITFGSNNCTANFEVAKNKFAHVCCKQGFSATHGWGVKPSNCIFCRTAPSGNIFFIFSNFSYRGSGIGPAEAAAPASVGAGPVDGTMGIFPAKKSSISCAVNPSNCIFCRTAPSGSIFFIFSYLSNRGSGTRVAAVVATAVGLGVAGIFPDKKPSISASVNPSIFIFCRTAPSGSISFILMYLPNLSSVAVGNVKSSPTTVLISCSVIPISVSSLCTGTFLKKSFNFSLVGSVFQKKKEKEE